MYLCLVNLFRQTTAFVANELRLEFRTKHALAALVLYVLTTVYLVYFALEYQGMKSQLLPVIWSIFFWIIIIFTIVNSTLQSLSKENAGRMLFYYTLLDAKVYILGKMMVNALLSLVLAVLTSLIFSVVLGNPAKNMGVFYFSLILGTMGYSFLFSYISALAAKAGSGAGLAVVLGFPLSLPLLSIIVKLFSESFLLKPDSNFVNHVGIAVAFNFIPLLLAIILFPYIWRE